MQTDEVRNAFGDITGLGVSGQGIYVVIYPEEEQKQKRRRKKHQ